MIVSESPEQVSRGLVRLLGYGKSVGRHGPQPHGAGHLQELHGGVQQGS